MYNVITPWPDVSVYYQYQHSMHAALAVVLSAMYWELHVALYCSLQSYTGIGNPHLSLLNNELTQLQPYTLAVLHQSQVHWWGSSASFKFPSFSTACSYTEYRDVATANSCNGLYSQHKGRHMQSHIRSTQSDNFVHKSYWNSVASRLDACMSPEFNWNRGDDMHCSICVWLNYHVHYFHIHACLLYTLDSFP